MFWGAMLIASLGLLFGLAYLTGHGPPAGARRELRDSLQETVTRPTVSLPAAFAILTLLAYSCRRVTLEWLAWRPGRIQVPDFTATGLTSGSAAQLTTVFRDGLARMRLTSSGAVPAAQPESTFLNVLSTAQVSSSNILATLLGLLRAASPSYAYEIRGVIAERAGPPHDYRVTLQIVRLPSEGGPQVEVIDTDPDRAIRLAADSATAAILPRTRLCKGPWVAWRRYVMPGALFNAYEEACENEALGRYDRARSLYYRALDHDPMNAMLRLQLGLLQEKRQMPLEALATYTGMIEAARPADQDLPAGLYPRRVERERRRTLLIARYRRTVLLGEGSFMKEWRVAADDRHGKREVRLVALCHQVQPWLRDRMDEHHVHEDSLLPESQPSEEERQLLRTFARDCATAEVAKLRRDLPLTWKLPWIRRLIPRPPLTKRALDLIRLCIDQRGLLATSPADHCGRSTSAADLDAKVGGVERTLGRRRPLKRWEEQYNAACLFAIPLLGAPLRDGCNEAKCEQKRLAEHAVSRLELAAACADSSFIADRRAWVTAEDPDLAGLRPLEAFETFESQYFPSGAPMPRHPRREHELAELHCTRDLLRDAARGWEAVWRTRASKCDAGARQEAARWWSDEREVWRHIHRVADHRDWRARLELADATSEWHVSYEVDPVEPVFKRNEKPGVAAAELDVNKACEAEITEVRERLHALAAMLSDQTEAHSYRSFTTGFGALDVFDAEPTAFSPTTRGRFCLGQAAVWRRLHEWLVADNGRDAGDAKRALERELWRARRLWRLTAVGVRLRRVRCGELRYR